MIEPYKRGQKNYCADDQIHAFLRQIDPVSSHVPNLQFSTREVS